VTCVNRLDQNGFLIVAYKLAQGLSASTAEEDLELVALATVADLMPLRGENRRLVRAGLAALGSTAKPGLRALMESARVDPSALDVHVLGFRLAPRINAAGRIARADAGLELLLTSDPGRAEEIARELELVNAERRAVEQRIVWGAESQARELGERPAYVLAGEGWHPGVIGIVASRIVESHHRPAVVIAIDPDGECHGSGRSIPGFDLLGALDACAAHLERYGGHTAAAGLSICRDQLEHFRAAFEDHAGAVLTPELLTPLERVDAVVSGSQLGLDLADELQRLEPTGIGNPRSRLLVPGSQFSDARQMGEGRHVRFTVTAGGTRSPAVAFGCGGRLPVAEGEPVNASFRLERNCWNGRVEPRLVLRCAWRAEHEPIEVLGEDGDYLATVLDEIQTEGLASVPSEPAGARRILDRRGESQLALLADARATDGSVLAVCADVGRRPDHRERRDGQRRRPRPRLHRARHHGRDDHAGGRGQPGTPPRPGWPRVAGTAPGRAAGHRHHRAGLRHRAGRPGAPHRVRSLGQRRAPLLRALVGAGRLAADPAVSEPLGRTARLDVLFTGYADVEAIIAAINQVLHTTAGPS